MTTATASCCLREAPTGWGERPAGRGARPLLGRAARGTARGGGAEGGIAASAPKATAAEVERLFPGLLATMLPEEPGMHRSATVDVLYVVAGRCVLELDDGSKTELGAGDVVVQSGTMHRWHNPWAEPCRIIGLLVGARLQ